MHTHRVLKILVAVVILAGCAAQSRLVEKSWFQFQPLAASAYLAPGTDTPSPAELDVTPWMLPAGFTQSIVVDETRLDIYKATLCIELRDSRFAPGADWPDMITLNETGAHVGRYLYRTHEIRPFLYDPKCAVGAVPKDAKQRFAEAGGGAVSVVDLVTGEARVLLQRRDLEALDGLVWTPWGTLLFAEEVIETEMPDPDMPHATSGLVYEATLDPADPGKLKSLHVRPLLGSLAHEGLEVDTGGNVYVIDENKLGSIYRFVPQRRGDLSAGQLYALKVDGGKQTGAATWVALDMELAQRRARDAASLVGATTYCRPEDIEHIGSTLYVATTCEDVTDARNEKGSGAVLAIQLRDQPQVSYFVGAGINAPAENAKRGVTGFKNPDNLASGPDGRLWIVEDNVPSDIWVAEPDSNGDGHADALHLFASLKDPWAEGTGLYFRSDKETLYVNVQHSRTGNDKTVAITRRQ